MNQTVVLARDVSREWGFIAGEREVAISGGVAALLDCPSESKADEAIGTFLSRILSTPSANRTRIDEAAELVEIVGRRFVLLETAERVAILTHVELLLAGTTNITLDLRKRARPAQFLQ